MPREDLQDWADVFLHGELGLRRGITFGHPSYSRGKTLFAFLYDDGLCIKCNPDVTKQRSEENPDVYSIFTPDHPMRNWLVIVHPEVQEYDRERSFIEEWLGKLVSR